MNRLVFPIVIALLVGTLSITLLTIGFNSPYTHENLVPRFDSAYSRTEQTVVGPPEPIPAARLGEPLPATATAVERGKALMVSKGCAACHGLEGRGGAVGPPMLGFTTAKFEQRTRKGPGGMPAYGESALTNQDMADLEAYLDSLVDK